MLAVVLTFLGTLLLLAVSTAASAADKDVRLTYRDDQPVKLAQGLNPISFNFSIQHTGMLMSEEVYVYVENEPPYWQHYLTSQTRMDMYFSTNFILVMLQKGEKANVSLTITPYGEELNRTFWMTLNVYPKGASDTNRSCDIGVIIPQTAVFEVRVFNEPEPGYFAAIPPAQVTVRFALFNAGNGNDRFLVRYESSRSDAGWTMRPDGAGIDEFGWTPYLAADPGKQHPHLIDFKVTIPAEEKADITCQVLVEATSSFCQTKQMPPAHTTIRTLQYYDFQVHIDGPDRREGSPNEQVVFRLRIWNRGNGMDRFEIVPVWDEEDAQGFFVSANPHTVDVGSNETTTVDYIVKVPEAAPKKDYFFMAEVSSASPDLVPVTKSFELEVGQFYKLALRSPQPQMSTRPGGSLVFDVFLRNVGNGLDSMTIRLEDVPSGWITYVEPLGASLLQGEEASLKVTVIVPSAFDAAPIGSYELQVLARSARSDALARLGLRIEIVQFYRIEWMYQGLPITDDTAPIAQSGIIKPRRIVNPYEKNYIDIPLEVKNFGNGDDNITLWGYAVNPLINVSVSPPVTMLKRDELKLVKVRIEVPQTLPPGIYSLFVNASSQDRLRPVKVVPLDFEVFNLDARVPPIPTYVNPDGTDSVQSEIKVTEGTNMSLKLRVENSGTRFINGVLVKVYDNYYDAKAKQDVRWNFFNFTTSPIAVGDKYIVGERPFSASNPPILWWASVSGAHTIEFEITYDFQSTNANDVSSVNVMVEKRDDGGPPPTVVAYGLVIAIAVAAITAVLYVFVLRTRPEVDRDLYGSIYGADFEEGAPPLESYATGEAAEAVPAGPALTPEQQALYGDDYGGAEGADEGDEGYDAGDYDEGEEQAQ